ncbi:MAG TPA: hypothetical protein VFZ75_11225 [Actinomycetota bacterium]|nr:hypothetical protein [Actinomycetota bacterium]
MKKAIVILAILGVGSIGLASTAGSADTATILKADTMAGVIAPYTGATNAIRGVPGGGLPWELSGAKVVLGADGRLEMKVEGLVLVATGENPIPMFRGLVSCQSIDGTGGPAVVNRMTDPFPASMAGDSKIEATLDLPEPCFAPIVFVTSPTGSWFAVTGV